MGASADRKRVVPVYHSRIPEDLPVLVWTSPHDYAWHVSRRGLLTVYVPILAAIAVTIFGFFSVTNGSVQLLAYIGGVSGLIYLVRFLEAAAKSRSPLIGADRGGLFLRPNGRKLMTVRLPWPDVKDLAVRRAAGVWMLCVTPRDPRIAEQDQELAVGHPRSGFWWTEMYQRIVRQTGTTLFVPVIGPDPQRLLADLNALRARS